MSKQVFRDLQLSGHPFIMVVRFLFLFSTTFAQLGFYETSRFTVPDASLALFVEVDRVKISPLKMVKRIEVQRCPSWVWSATLRAANVGVTYGIDVVLIPLLFFSELRHRVFLASILFFVISAFAHMRLAFGALAMRSLTTLPTFKL